MTTVTSATAAASVAAATTSSSSSSSLDMTATDFLSLLTTQLQNQDPLNPTDPSQFTDQLVQINEVEQQTQTNSTLSQILAGQSSNMMALGVGYIGKDVQAEGDSFTNSGGQSVSLAYNLPSAATSGTISITDSSGNVVYTATPSLTEGTSTFTWNGTDTSGNAVPSGTYTLTVSAENSSGQALNVTTYVPGLVSGIETASDGTLSLSIGNTTVPLSSVIGVSEAS
jgi:flagellar basal-body rod modification protein FlgD